MKQTETIIKLASKNNGVITSSMITKAGISRGNLKYVVDNGMLEKTTRGVYILPDILEDEFVNLQTRFKKGIFSKETALFFHDLIDRTPNIFSMTFPDNYNLTKIKDEGIAASRATGIYYNLGITEIISPARNLIRAYDVEKTLCDLLRPRSNVDIQVISEAFKRYISRKEKNIPKLSDYAKKLKVEKKVRMYLEVLL